jgi:hypothetical protein
MLLVYEALEMKSSSSLSILDLEVLKDLEIKQFWESSAPETVVFADKMNLLVFGRDLALLPHKKSCRAHRAVVLSRGTTRGHSECWITGTERPPGRANMTGIESSRF